MLPRLNESLAANCFVVHSFFPFFCIKAKISSIAILTPFPLNHNVTNPANFPYPNYFLHQIVLLQLFEFVAKATLIYFLISFGKLSFGQTRILAYELNQFHYFLRCSWRANLHFTTLRCLLLPTLLLASVFLLPFEWQTQHLLPELGSPQDTHFLSLVINFPQSYRHVRREKR